MAKLIEGVRPRRWKVATKGKPPRPLPKDIKVIWHNHPMLAIGNPLLSTHCTVGAKWYGVEKWSQYGFWIEGPTVSKRKLVASFWKHHAKEYYASKQVNP